MKQFFKFLFASMLGFIIGGILLIFLFIGIISAMVSSVGSKEVTVKPSSILEISLDYPLKDRSNANPFQNLNLNSMKSNKQPGLNEILKAIDHAAKDENIKGIYLNISEVNSGFANLQELREKLNAFKKSRKFIYAYADDYSQGAYYLASVADQVVLNPRGAISLKGLATELMFFKGMLDKLEVQAEVIRHGKYKSAIEPFILDKMSPENREQIAAFVNPIWDEVCTAIASSRKINTDDIKHYADSLIVRNADDALKYRLADKLAYYDEFIAMMNSKIGKGKDDKTELISINDYVKAPFKETRPFTKDKIAVIYAVGEISDGEGDDESIGSAGLSEEIRKARLDKNVKAIVLRVNSPGGSALASEVIWRETALAKKAKPLIVSMGNVAASGGYYISCAADKIIADPTTITGSIGVFGLMFNAENMFKNKLGITFDTYKTGTFTDMGTMSRGLTPYEEEMLRRDVDDTYNTFTKRVADGRKLIQANVDSLGQGRVWSAVNAKEIGLVDEFGGLQKAVEMAASMAHISNYRIKELPEQKDALEEIVKGLSGEAETWYMKNRLGADYIYWQASKHLERYQGIQARTFLETGFR